MGASVNNILLVFAGGGLGAVARYEIQQIVGLNSAPYWTTTAVNTTGCFLIGLLWVLLGAFDAGRGYYLLCVTGFLGGFTTYSAFTGDAMNLIQAGMLKQGLLYITATVFGGIVAYTLGAIAAHSILKTIQ